MSNNEHAPVILVGSDTIGAAEVIRERLLSFEFEDHDNKADICKFTLDQFNNCFSILWICHQNVN